MSLTTINHEAPGIIIFSPLLTTISHQVLLILSTPINNH